MKPYGVTRKDRGCCPGHDKYPNVHYATTTAAAKRRWQKHRKTRARMDSRRLIAINLQEDLP